jgi:hypothetical protein
MVSSLVSFGHYNVFVTYPRKATVILLTMLLVSPLFAENANERDFQAARAEYEQASPQDESARLIYVNKLAQIIDRNVQERWKTGVPNPDYLKIVDAINSELKKHPMPNNSDPKKLRDLIVGQWQSPRHIYIFRHDGKYGVQDGAMDTSWHIQGNQIAMPRERRTILLLNSKYLIFSEGDTVFFHSRVSQ